MPRPSSSRVGSQEYPRKNGWLCKSFDVPQQLIPTYGVTQTFAHDHGPYPYRIFGGRWMDTVTGGPFGPRSERPIQVFRCSVGRKDPTPPRHEARRPRLPEVGPKTTCGVTGLSTFTSSRIHPSFDATRARRLLVDISLSIPVGPIYCHDHQTSLL